MMDFSMRLAIIFYGGMVWVHADFYVEIKDWVPSTLNQRRPAEDTYLYGCKGIPRGISAFRALRSECTPVISFEQKSKIHATSTFYSVFQPDLRSHQIHLSNRGILSHDKWNVGFSNFIDHPNFGGPWANDFDYFMTKVEAMGGEPIVEPDENFILASYFAQANVIAYFTAPSRAYTQITTFATVLQRMINEYTNINQIRSETAADQSRNRIRRGMKVALQRMLDPCTFLRGIYQPSASTHCDIYCKFLNIVALNFGPTSDRCTSLVGGHCQSVTCTCRRASSSLFRGCRSSPMRMCNNALRVKLDL